MTVAAPVLAFVGRSGCGKTSLLEALIPELARRGYRVAVVKHSCHAGIETDVAGSDSRRLWDAGAAHAVLASPDRIVHARRFAEPELWDAVAEIADVDLILVEGFKAADVPKVEVVRAACDPAPLDGLRWRVACVTDLPDLPCGDMPRFAFEAVHPLANWIESFFELGAAGHRRG